MNERRPITVLLGLPAMTGRAGGALRTVDAIPAGEPDSDPGRLRRR